jgi:REase_DpnII-MboI
LLRQLGRLRPYLEELHSTWTLGVKAVGVSWNVLDEAIGTNQGAQIKGPSLNAFVDALEIILGRLDNYNDAEEFRMGTLVTVNTDIELAERICARVAKAARILTARRGKKASFEIKDEYDVQDLIHALFRAFFKYPVTENPLPKAAGAVSTRADLCIEELGLIMEAKFVRAQKDQARIEKELATDLIFYSAWEPLKYLFFVVYNSADLQNAELLDKFSKPQTINAKHFTARVIAV